MPYKTFGPYILFKQIRSDVLGELWRAGEISAGGVDRTVWLRLLSGSAVPVDEVKANLGSARRIGEILKAVNVIADPAFVEDGGVPALAGTHVPSQTLSALFEKAEEEGFPVPVDNALLILEKLSMAVSAGLAVEVGGVSLVHGFLHPDLAFVTTDGEALVMGFGVGEALLGLLDDASAAPGVLPYIAPEVIVSRNPSKRGDVYSLGSILYQLVTGKPLPAPPEERSGVLETAEIAFEDEPVPDDIKALLARALAPRPEDRFSSAADFKKELDKLLYGGRYSPTTFNLALFMDRLFRTEVEQEEKERLTEKEVDVTPYLAPTPEPEEAAEPEPVAPAGRSGSGRGVLLGIAGAAVVVAIVALVLLNRGPAPPEVPPTPTAEEVAAQKQQEEERLQAMIQEMVRERMAEKEEEIRAELSDRQQQIEELRTRLQASEARSRQGQTSAEERKAQEELQRQIAAAEEAQRQQQAALEAERQRVAAQERERLAAQQAATATAAAELAAAAAAETPTPPPPVRAAATVPPAEPTTAPAESAAAPAEPTPAAVEVTENMFVPPSEVDSQPVVLREEAVSWSRIAIQSRQRGLIIAQATVNAQGTVDEVTILRADSEGFGIPEAVIDAVKQYRFKPATKDGVRVKTHVTVTKRYNFRNR